MNTARFGGIFFAYKKFSAAVDLFADVITRRQRFSVWNAAYIFNDLIKHPDDFTDRASFYRLAQVGQNAVAQKNFDDVRRIIFELWNLGGRTDDEFLTSNSIAAEFLELIGNEIVRNVGTAADIIAVDKKFSALNVKKICWLINAVRAKSKFPAVQDTAAIRDELKNLRDEIRGMIQDTLKTMSHIERIKLANTLANGENFGVVIEDFFDSYLAAQVKAFADAMRPLDKFSEALGTNNFAATEKIFYTVRDAAINMFNEKDLINDSLILTRTLEQNFSYPSHLDAKAALENILAAMKYNLHFTEGFEQANLKFYHDQFKPIHERNLQGLMLKGCFT